MRARHPGRRLAAAAAAAMALAACAGASSADRDVAAAAATVGAESAGAHRPPFTATVRRLSPARRRAMTGVSWHRGCPVGLGRLRVVRLRFWGFDRRAHRGRLIVDARIARRTVRAFRALYRARFPIRRIRPIDAYGGSDGASMAADNTSAFNCRRVTGAPGRWSNHAYGRAIDVNPVENPYVRGSTVLPRAGRRYADRSRCGRGMIRSGSRAARAFTEHGFSWGGDYTGLRDYQHFERVR